MVKKLTVKLFELNEAYQKVIGWFFSYPTKEMSLSDLAMQLEISKKSASKVVSILGGEGFLKKEVLGKIWRITATAQHPYNITRKISYNLGMIYSSDIILQIHKYLHDEMGQTPRAIILFGSYRKGDDTERSDIDIAVEILGDKSLEMKEFRIFPNFGYRENVPVNLHIFTRNNIDLNLFANIANGIVLEGFLEVRP